MKILYLDIFELHCFIIEKNFTNLNTRVKIVINTIHFLPQQPPLALTHGPLVSHAAAAIMQSPALASPAGSPATAHPAPPQHHPSAHNPPCSTLFIANLGHNVAEQELKDIFSR